MYPCARSWLVMMQQIKLHPLIHTQLHVGDRPGAVTVVEIVGQPRKVRLNSPILCNIATLGTQPVGQGFVPVFDPQHRTK